MATITTAGSGNWSSTTPNAPWPSGTKPTTGDVVEIAAGHTVTLDENTAVLGAAGVKNVAGSNTSVLDINGTVTLNGCVSYSGTATTGFVTLGTGDALTINHNGGAGTSAVTNSSTGYAIVGGGSGALTISNTGGTCITTSNGRGMSWGASGTLSVTGTTGVSCSGGRGLSITSGATGTKTVTGNVVSTGGTAIYTTTGTTTLDGVPTSSGAGIVIDVQGGTIVWTGSRTIAQAEDCYINVDSGTLNLSNLALTLSGVFVIRNNTGTITTTSASITIQAVDAIAAGLGVDLSSIVSGPTLPNEHDVDDTAAQYGYAGALKTGVCHLPDAAEVQTGVGFGAHSTEFTGTLAASGGGARIIGG